MSPLEEARLNIASETYGALAQESILTPVQARLFVRCFQKTWLVPTIFWSQRESNDQLMDARRLLNAAEIFSEIQGAASLKAQLCYRRAAELLEWLSRSGDNTDSTTPIELLAAGAYQLAGLPAMATAMLKLSENSDLGARIFSCFLQADFDGVLTNASDFWSKNSELTRRNGSTHVLNSKEEDSLSTFFAIELVRVVGLVSDALRKGEESRLEIAARKFEALHRLANRMADEDIALTISMMIQSYKKYLDSSIYKPLMQLSQSNPEKMERLRNFARIQFSRKRGVLWTSQLLGIQRLLSSSRFAICTPTGSGKTLVANMALVKELLLNIDLANPAPLALYLVPSRALAGEVETKLQSELGSDMIITGLYGGTDWGITDYWLKATTPTVLIATVEKAEALMRYLGVHLIARLKLLIIDEAHQVVADDSDHGKNAFADHSSRPLRMESFVARLLSQKPEMHRIALTAVAGGASGPVASWIEGIKNAEPVGANFRSTRQIVGMMVVSPNRGSEINVDLINGHEVDVQKRDSPIYIGLNVPPIPKLLSKIRNSVNHFNQINVLWTALHLLSGGRRILISVLQSPEKTMKWFVEAFELETWRDIPTFLPPIQGKNGRLWSEAISTCNDYCGINSYEAKLLQRGIATNHGQMPQRLRRLMSSLIESGICPITVATATLTEGVNLPFDIIFLTSLERTIFINEDEGREVTPISTSEFRNLAGRAGRPGFGTAMEGLTLVSIPLHPPTTAAAQINKQKTQIDKLKSNYLGLLLRLQNEKNNTSAKSPLALLLLEIKSQAAQILGIVNENDFLHWLEAVIPTALSAEAGLGNSSPISKLADTIDELDGLLLSSIEELSQSREKNLTRASTEALLIDVWQKTFSAVASQEANWLERVFIHRGVGLVETVYADPNERKRLYQYGFTPCVGRRFEAIAVALKLGIQACTDYGVLDKSQRFMTIYNFGKFLTDQPGFGFKVGNTKTGEELLDNWAGVLSWWMQLESATHPAPENLRAWQKFVSDNLEFRLGVALGAVVAQAWTSEADDPLAIPSLNDWRETTRLPWFGFWVRELLRWGTLDPFVAFCLAQGISVTRRAAEGLRPDFNAWLKLKIADLAPDDFIDPRNFLAWQKNLRLHNVPPLVERAIHAFLTGTQGEKLLYKVIPVVGDNEIFWLDAAGYELAYSIYSEKTPFHTSQKNDYELRIDNGKAAIHEVFSNSK